MSAARVRVPATSANLGPAFDCAGLALSRHDVLEFAVQPSGLAVEVSGVGAGELPADESHLVVRAFRAACAELGWSPPGLRVVAENAIPQGRGMGSSAAAVVAGVLGAWALCPEVEDIDLDAVLRLTSELEGHPDNVAPAVLGGFTIAYTDGQGPAGFHAVRLDVDPALCFVVLVPEVALETKVARGLLPSQVPHRDAARNAGRSALLVAALTGRPDQLMAATEDRLHQQYRAGVLGASSELLRALRDAGVPATVSGAGPTVLVLAGPGHRAARDAVLADLVDETAGWRRLSPGIDLTGARARRIAGNTGALSSGPSGADRSHAGPGSPAVRGGSMQ